MHFQRQRADVLVADGVGHGTDERGVGDDAHRRVDEVEDNAQVDGKGVLALADENLGRRAAAGDADAVDVLCRVGRVVGNGLHADVVHRLAQAFAARGGVGDAGGRAAAAITSHQREAEGLCQVQRCVAGIDHAAGLHQRNGDLFAADIQRRAGATVAQRVAEAELEGQVLLAVAVVVDVGLVQRAGVHREVVGAAVGVLQRLVVGDQRHEVGAARLVAAEHVEVGAVDLGAGGDEGRFAVAGRQGRAGGQQRGGKRQRGLLEG